VGRSIIDGGDGLLIEASVSAEKRTRIGNVTPQTAAFLQYILIAMFDGVGAGHLKGTFVYLWCI
jgi:hypothetical protein